MLFFIHAKKKKKKCNIEEIERRDAGAVGKQTRWPAATEGCGVAVWGCGASPDVTNSSQGQARGGRQTVESIGSPPVSLGVCFLRDTVCVHEVF